MQLDQQQLDSFIETQINQHAQQNWEHQDSLLHQFLNARNTTYAEDSLKKPWNTTSFFSKDLTQDHSLNYSHLERFEEVTEKIEVEITKNSQLKKQLKELEQKMTEKFLKPFIEDLETLTNQNKTLRQKYKLKKFNIPSNDNAGNVSQTPKNPKMKKQIAGGSMCDKNQKVFNQTDYIQPQKLDMTRQSLKPLNWENVNNIQQSLGSSPKKHKRRQSQLTQRKDYPNQNQENFMFDLQQHMEEDTGRMSLPGQRQKKNKQNIRCLRKNLKFEKRLATLESCQRISQNWGQAEIYHQPFDHKITDKNIFNELLQQMLVEEKTISYEFTTDMTEGLEQLKYFKGPNYHNAKHIEELQNQIKKKNDKLRQLQYLVNVFKQQIQQVMGTDVKQVDEMMNNLLQVKGKYIQMQNRVDQLSKLKRELNRKQEIKNNILKNIQQKIQKQGQDGKVEQQDIQIFPVPQSLKTFLQIIGVNLPPSAKPKDYLYEVKQIKHKKELFSKTGRQKSAQSIKIRQLIDSIREGRKKVNQLLKIYEGRIQKLQQKIKKVKASMAIQKQ